MFINKRCLLGLFSGMLLTTSMSAKVPVNINSGMPAYPFPQFKSYKMGVNLGMKQYEGLTHAEMEKDIRGAYQLFANEWEYSGEECDGVKYIRGNIGCPYDCSEGDGYSLLAAAYMGDKVSFDGLWMRIHDVRRAGQIKYLDGEPVGESGYGYNILGDDSFSCSAADGDWNMALALYVAWKQWGDDSGHKTFTGEAISYKKELIDVVSGLAEIYDERFKDENPRRVTCGNIGLDGYPKNGTTWLEITDWAIENPIEKDGVTYIPEYRGPVSGHTDYLSPAFCYEFYKLLDEVDTESDKEWLKSRFLRATASADWIMGSWLEQNEKNLPYSEMYTIDKDNVVTFEAGNLGGRFRSVWETSLNYVWHGNPNFTWNPESHQVEDKPNTYEQTVCKRAAAYCAAPQKWTGANCVRFAGSEASFDGTDVLSWDVQPDGSSGVTMIGLGGNWVPGVSTGAAVGAEDLDLTAKLYRRCQIEWDSAEDSVPMYFHGWFRLYGMLCATGNFFAPSDIKPEVNIRLYKSIKDGKTVCYPGDNVTFLLDYRNYGSEYSEEFVITEKLPDGFEFVSADNGGVYDPAEHTITFSLNRVGGRIYDDLDKTQGRVSYTIKAKEDAEGMYSSISTLSYDDVVATADAYPNNVTATYEVNSITVLPNKLKVTTEVSKNIVVPEEEVEYTISFANVDTTKVVGGRKDVAVSVASTAERSNMNLYMRLWNDAAEPLINLGNYRVSYYTNEILLDQNIVYEGGKNIHGDLSVLVDTISQYPGKELYRVVMQFDSVLSTTTAHLSNFVGLERRIHEGVTIPLRVEVLLRRPSYEYLDYTNYFSYDPDSNADRRDLYYPVAPRYVEYGNPDKTEISNGYVPSVCESADHVYSNIAVEEFDGYVWRLVQGNIPNVGHDLENVTLYDTLPAELEFVEFTSESPLDKIATLKAEKVEDGRTLIVWQSSLMPAEEYKISFKVKVKEDVSLGDVNNVVVVDAEGASAFSDSKLTINEPQGVDNVSNINLELVSPNPTKDSWTILRDCEYEIYNAVGSKVEKGSVEAGSLIGTKLPTGVYLLKTLSGESQKLIKE